MVRFEQTTFRLPAQRRGCHLVTNFVTKEINELMQGIDVGMCQIFLQHTSASLSINENCDPDVRHDMETFLSQVVPEGHGPKVPWTHTDEGTDDMPGTSLDVSTSTITLNLPLTLSLSIHHSVGMSSAREVLHVRRLAEHSHHEGTAEFGHMARGLALRAQGSRLLEDLGLHNHGILNVNSSFYSSLLNLTAIHAHAEDRVLISPLRSATWRVKL